MIEKPHILRSSLATIFSFIATLWIIRWLEWNAHVDLGFLGILPRTLTGTMGIVTAPLIHGDWFHLISNTFPLLLLGISVFYFYHRIALEVFGWIYFMSGFWVWMAARDAYHIGASGLVYGLVAFLFFSGIFRRDLRSLTISLLVIFLYGGMIQGIFPGNEQISWESHFLGSLAGIFCAFFYKNEVSGTESATAILAPAAHAGTKTYRQLQEEADLYAVHSINHQRAPISRTEGQALQLTLTHSTVPVKIIFQPKPDAVYTDGRVATDPFSAPNLSQTTYRIKPTTAEPAAEPISQNKNLGTKHEAA